MAEPSSIALVLSELNGVIDDKDHIATGVQQGICIKEALTFLEEVREFIVQVESQSLELSVEAKQALDALRGSIRQVKDQFNQLKSKRRLYWMVFAARINHQVGEAMQGVKDSLRLLQLAKVPVFEDGSKQLDNLARRRSLHYEASDAERRISSLVDGRGSSDTDLDALSKFFTTNLGLSTENDNLVLWKELRLLKDDLETVPSSELLMHMVDKLLALQLETKNTPEDSENEILPPFDSFECPLLKQIMEDPVVLQSEHTYERRAIQEWFKTCRDNNRPPTCPVSGKVLTSTDLLPNLVLRQTIDEWYQRNVTVRINILRQKLKTSDKVEVEVGLDDILRLSNEKRLNKFKLREAKLVPEIVKVWNLNEASALRAKALMALNKMAVDDVDNQFEMAVCGVSRLAVRSLGSKHADEQKNAAKLLFLLSEQPSISTKLATEKGAIIHLDNLAGHRNQNPELADLAEKTLENLEQDSNIFNMAEAGRFEPLVSRLANGPENTQLEIAKYLSDHDLANRLKELVARDAGHVLVEMLSRDMDTKAASMGALLRLSTREVNSPLLIKAGVIPVLLDIMFSILSSFNRRCFSLKENAAKILATLVSVPGTWEDTVVNAEGDTMISEYVIHNLLGLLAHVKPNWKDELLLVLFNMASSPRASVSVSELVRNGNGLIVLVSLVQDPETSHRINAVKLLELLSARIGAEVLGSVSRELHRIIDMLKSGNREESLTGASFLSSLPLTEDQVVQVLGAELVSWTVAELTNNNTNDGSSKQDRSISKQLSESLLGILVHFTRCSDAAMVTALQDTDVMSVLLRQLEKQGQSGIAKQRTLLALKHLSIKAPGLGQQARGTGAQQGLLSKLLGSLCFSPAPSTEQQCPVHTHICSSSRSFCLVGSKGLPLLIEMLDDEEVSVQLASLEAVSTLLDDSTNLRGAVDVVNKAEGLKMAMEVFYANKSQDVQERSLWIIERFLRVEEYSKTLAVDPRLFRALVDVFKHGSPVGRSLAQEALTSLKELSGLSGAKRRR